MCYKTSNEIRDRIKMKNLLCCLIGKFVEMLKSVDGKVPVAIPTKLVRRERPPHSPKTWPGDGEKEKTNLGNHFPNTAAWPRDPLETQVGNQHPCSIIHNPSSQDAYSWEIQTSITEMKMPLLRWTQRPSSSLSTPHCLRERASFSRWLFHRRHQVKLKKRRDNRWNHVQEVVVSSGIGQPLIYSCHCTTHFCSVFIGLFYRSISKLGWGLIRLSVGVKWRINYPCRNRQECKLGELSTRPKIDGFSENIHLPPRLSPKANRINSMFVKCLIP